MELRQIRYFLMVARELHFGRAAQQLNIVQPALSKQIRVLEDELGVSLFDRDHRGTRLSSAGALFLPEAQRILDQVESARRTARRAGGGEVGVVQLGYSESVIHSGLFSTVLRAAQARYPEIEIVAQRVEPWLCPELLSGQRIDLFLGVAPLIDMPARLALDTITQLPICLALPHDHPLATQTRIDRSSLSAETFIEYADNDQETHDVVAHLAGIHPRGVRTARDPMSSLAMVEAGQGLSLIPIVLSNPHLQGVTYRPLRQVHRSVRIGLAARSNESQAHVLNLRQLIRQATLHAPVDGRRVQ